MPSTRDINQIAFSTLNQATLTEPQPGETAGQRAMRTGTVVAGIKGGEIGKARVTPEQRRANGLKGAIARWGEIAERDNSAMPARPKNLDMNQLAKHILDEATGGEPKTEAPVPAPERNQAAVELGRLGGKKGGIARNAALTPEQRSEIAKKAAAGRWQKSNAK
jgi:hypothetical protein